MEINNQKQNAGEQSVNIQANKIEIVNGLTYQDVRNIALDVFESNFYKLSGRAAETAKQRAEEITERFLKELQKRNSKGINNAVDPDFQHALFTMQKEYARSGDTDLADILVDLLVDRSKETTRSLVQIVLNEALQIVPKLTIEQINALTLIFTLKYTQYLKMYNLDSLNEYIDKYIQPFIHALPEELASFQHIEYTGCGANTMMGSNVMSIFLQRYKALFCKGFNFGKVSSLISKKPEIKNLIMICFHEDTLLQLKPINDDIMHKLSEEYQVDKEVTNKLIEIQNSFLMNENEVKEFLISVNPIMNNLIVKWDQFLQSINLTSVGIAIAHGNYQRLTGDTTPLSVWIK